MFDGAGYLSDARRAAVRLRELEAQVAAEREALYECGPGGGGMPSRSSSGESDPTWRGVLSVRSRRRRLDWLLSEREACREQVDDLRAVLAGMAEALGPECAETCRRYYLDGVATGDGWAEVASAMGVTERTALRRRSVAVDWLSDVGLANARAGRLMRGVADG